MDLAPMLLICTPILLPMMIKLGVDPVHFGMIMLINLGIGLITPPVGPTLFVGCAIGKVTIEQVSKELWPFYGADVAWRCSSSPTCRRSRSGCPACSNFDTLAHHTVKEETMSVARKLPVLAALVSPRRALRRARPAEAHSSRTCTRRCSRTTAPRCGRRRDREAHRQPLQRRRVPASSLGNERRSTRASPSPRRHDLHRAALRGAKPRADLDRRRAFHVPAI